MNNTSYDKLSVFQQRTPLQESQQININMRKTILSCFHIFCNILIARLYAYMLITEWPQKTVPGILN